MAASITTTATKLENQLVEVALAMQNAEATRSATNPDFEQRLSIVPDAEGGTISISVTLPATVSGTGGNVTLTPVEYLL